MQSFAFEINQPEAFIAQLPYSESKFLEIFSLAMKSVPVPVESVLHGAMALLRALHLITSLLI